jgi:hypothetical protein
MNERQAEIILWYSDQLRAGIEDDSTLLERARSQGFGEAEIRDAIQAAQDQVLGTSPVAAEVASGDEAPRPLAVAQLSEEATRFLNSLRDLGYLDDALEDEVLDLLMSELPLGSSAQDLPNIELDDLRPHVATVLFDRQQDLDAETLRLLEEEWRLAFY